MKKTFINDIEIKGLKVAYDGCHKIYIIEDTEDEKQAIEFDYKLYDIKDLEDIYINSCDLKFISNWKLNINYVRQFENANFRYE